MFLYTLFLFFLGAQADNIYSVQTREHIMDRETGDEVVDVKLYYESMCLGCRQDYHDIFMPLVMGLSQYLNVNTYPCGWVWVQTDGAAVCGYSFVNCQHGKDECYGNILHACAIDNLKKVEAYVPFNACLLNATGLGSNDTTADLCGKELNVDSEPIKKCAKDLKGYVLFMDNIVATEAVRNIAPYMPYLVVNGKPWDHKMHLKQFVCGEFKNPPKYCQDDSHVVNATMVEGCRKM